MLCKIVGMCLCSPPCNDCVWVCPMQYTKREVAGETSERKGTFVRQYLRDVPTLVGGGGWY